MQVVAVPHEIDETEGVMAGSIAAAHCMLTFSPFDMSGLQVPRAWLNCHDVWIVL